MSARITKEAMGTVFMSCTGGSKNSETMGKRYARDPVKSPRKKARKNPRQIRPKENRMADQKAGSRACSQSARSVSTGPTRKIWFRIREAANCQRMIQKRMIRILRAKPGSCLFMAGASLRSRNQMKKCIDTIIQCAE